MSIRLLAAATLGLAATLALAASASAEPKQKMIVWKRGQDQIFHYEGNRTLHTFVRNDGWHGYVIHDYNKGKVFHFKQDPRTGIMIPFVPNG